ncbi:winged helix DNA-binding protein [Kribbella voronezhensis]|uniref:Winged helix DNA-binding protein n=1 Tax=Kribbella voronezhensis TaxID=2512212 RepID=A0A4R7SW07_9ACTN|nr:winged helix DNA-binding domain-containing protein [Kribbella voronezhensis]TDU83510.1 winged helix DNA-binding protein [Kribbella voronezhensis]
MSGLAWEAIVARRMRRHYLDVPAAGSPTDVVRAMSGAHAQVLSAAEISVALRMEKATRADVQRALWEDRTLVKTFGPRGTVHLLPADELSLWMRALSVLPRSGGQAAPAARMTSDQLAEVIEAIGSALSAGDLTMEELSEQVIARTGSWAGDLVMPAFQEFWPRWRQAIPAASKAGVLCYGPNRGRKTTYSNPQRFAPFAPGNGEEALSEVLRRFLHTYGPATPQQFAKWLSAPPGFVAKVFATTAGLEQVEVNGTTAWLKAGDTELPPEPVRGVRLLPYFDAYGVGSHPRELVFPGEAYTRALAGGQAGNYPVLLVDGIVAGVWHQKRSGRRLQVTVETLRPLKPAQLRSLDEQVERLGEIVGATPELTLGKVTVGPHA